MRTSFEKWQANPVAVTATILLLSVLMACFNYSAPLSNIGPGLDSAWAYTLNYLFHNNILLGRDAFFTFGPLGFLEHTRNISATTINYSLYFWLAMVLLINGLCYRLAFTTATNTLSLIIYLLIASFILLNTNIAGQKLLLAVYLTTLLAWLTQKYSYTILLGVLTSVAITMKFSYGAVALVALCGTALTVSLHLKSFRPLLAAGLSLGISYSAIWLTFGGSMMDGARYFVYGLEFTRGSASAMATYTSTSPLAVVSVAAALLALIVLTMARVKPQGWLMTLCFLLIGFIWFKYSFGRMDHGHLIGIMYFAYTVFLLGLLLNNSLAIKALSGGLLLVLFFFWSNTHNSQTGNHAFKGPNIQANKQHWFFAQLTNDKLFNMQENATRKLAERYQLSDDIKQKLGQQTAAVYPWENFIAHANKINWQPMPVIQNYIAYTPKLDHRNALFFEGNTAPQFIIWHHHSFASIDNRHHLSADPRTVTAILTNYQKTICDALACLWEKRSTPLNQQEKKRQHVPIQLDKWITQPEGEMQRFYISSQLTIKGLLYNLLWKEADLKIEYAFENGKTRQHRFIRENAKHGLWVSPYNAKPNEDWAKYGKVKAIRFKTSHPHHYKKWIGYWSVNEFPVEQL